ncbi:hypothetical protein INT43_007089 [Umbelopsis isabellina]|uniref:Adenylyl cyclase-associated protein n=1 Tax=Mortierella isabellina TaxID=91625 RepID=A0A8H7PXL9_MORIS|nr:hypothetical protein INT43_007089 [Umbelopsis isabellina]
MSEFHSLATLIKRLEVATTRLEDLALSGMSASTIAATNAPPAPAASASAPSEPTQVPRAVEEFSNAVDSPSKQYAELSQQLGGPVAEQAQLLQELVKAQRDFIHVASIAKKPDMSSPTFAKLVEPTQKALVAITDIKDKNRGHQQFNHLSAVAEGIPAFGWIAVEPTPAPYIQEMGNAAQFYSNRVVKEYKEKDPKQVDWTKAFLAIINELYAYVKEHHRTGLVWNANGESPEAAMSKITQSAGESQAPTATSSAPQPAPAPSAGGPPPPPPPPPVMTEFDEAPQKSAPAPATTGASAIFAELNKGESVTSGLKKVDKSQMTHKNPSLRAGSTVSEDSVKKQRPPTPSKPGKYVLKKPAVTELQGNKWVVEGHEGSNDITIEGEINHAVYIYGCKNSTIRIKGKVNAVTMDSCTKCGLAVDTIVSTVDLVNCKSFGLQIFNVTPTIVIDKCDGGQLYLSKTCLDVEVLTAKTSAVNILVPENDNEDAEFTELPVPEQLKSTIVNGKVVTTAVEHAG